MACPEYDRLGVCSKPAGKCLFPHVNNIEAEAEEQPKEERKSVIVKFEPSVDDEQCRKACDVVLPAARAVLDLVEDEEQTEAMDLTILNSKDGANEEYERAEGPEDNINAQDEPDEHEPEADNNVNLVDDDEQGEEEEEIFPPPLCKVDRGDDGETMSDKLTKSQKKAQQLLDRMSNQAGVGDHGDSNKRVAKKKYKDDGAGAKSFIDSSLGLMNVGTSANEANKKPMSKDSRDRSDKKQLVRCDVCNKKMQKGSLPKHIRDAFKKMN